MKRILLLLCLTMLSSAIKAQFDTGEGRTNTYSIKFSNDTIPNYIPDSSATPLWQIGRTHKPFFTSDTNGVISIMTDTISNYPTGSNNWFVIKIRHNNYGASPIISFWHKYQTSAGHDGGFVEYSRNKGLTWDNVSDSCNVDSGSAGGLDRGLVTSNFYSPEDTLQTGEPSFNGICDTMRMSQFQFTDYPGLKSTSGWGCSWGGVDTFYIRFRFISDTTPDTLAGWFIDSIRVDYYNMGGAVKTVDNNRVLNATPNPSYNGLFTFPSLKHEEHFSTEVFNAIGQRVYHSPYRHSLDLSTFPRGLYFYKVTDDTEYYSGRLLYE